MGIIIKFDILLNSDFGSSDNNKNRDQITKITKYCIQND